VKKKEERRQMRRWGCRAYDRRNVMRIRRKREDNGQTGMDYEGRYKIKNREKHVRKKMRRRWGVETRIGRGRKT
jgi:hypothetical protein